MPANQVSTGVEISIYVVSALAGNAWQESHVNPTVTQQGGGTGFGLWQWSYSRRDDLFNYLTSHGYSHFDPVGQMQFLIDENIWIGSFGGISSLKEFLYSDSTDIAMLTEAFSRCWEGAGTPVLDERIRFAYEAYDYILEHADDTSITDWITQPMYYISEADALKNSVLMYRFYSKGGGVLPTKRKKKMPVWMMVRYHY